MMSQVDNNIPPFPEKMKLEDLQTEIRKGVKSGEAKPLDIEDVIRRGRTRASQKQNAK